MCNEDLVSERLTPLYAIPYQSVFVIPNYSPAAVVMRASANSVLQRN
jgi:hypothetical protein